MSYEYYKTMKDVLEVFQEKVKQTVRANNAMASTEFTHLHQLTLVTADLRIVLDEYLKYLVKQNTCAICECVCTDSDACCSKEPIDIGNELLADIDDEWDIAGEAWCDPNDKECEACQ